MTVYWKIQGHTGALHSAIDSFAKDNLDALVPEIGRNLLGAPSVTLKHQFSALHKDQEADVNVFGSSDHWRFREDRAPSGKHWMGDGYEVPAACVLVAHLRCLSFEFA